MSLELLWKMENRLTFTDQHLSETCRCNSSSAEMLQFDPVTSTIKSWSQLLESLTLSQMYHNKHPIKCKKMKK